MASISGCRHCTTKCIAQHADRQPRLREEWVNLLSEAVTDDNLVP
ncbi:hypothetical protein [Streptomyces roseoverticillatus]|nr:hypothetical protein [Streptomyces roseoverticillatus]